MLYIYIAFGIITSAIISVFNIHSVSDIWIIPVSLIGSLLAYAILYFLTIWIYSIFVSTKKTYGKPSNFYYNAMNRFYSLMCQVQGLKIHVTGIEKLPKDRRVLFVCNHLSQLDPMVHSSLFPERRIAFITKISNYKIPIGGKFARRACYIPIDRENPKNAIESIHMAEGLIENNVTDIAVYPEGHRGNSYKMDEFKTGVFMIAMKTKCPVVVCTISGTERSVKKSMLKTTHVYFDILDVFESEGQSSKNMSEKAYNMMQENLDKRNGEKQ